MLEDENTKSHEQSKPVRWVITFFERRIQRDEADDMDLKIMLCAAFSSDSPESCGPWWPAMLTADDADENGSKFGSGARYLFSDPH